MKLVCFLFSTWRSLHPPATRWHWWTWRTTSWRKRWRESRPAWGEWWRRRFLTTRRWGTADPRRNRRRRRAFLREHPGFSSVWRRLYPEGDAERVHLHRAFSCHRHLRPDSGSHRGEYEDQTGSVRFPGQDGTRVRVTARLICWKCFSGFQGFICSQCLPISVSDYRVRLFQSISMETKIFFTETFLLTMRLK